MNPILKYSIPNIYSLETGNGKEHENNPYIPWIWNQVANEIKNGLDSWRK